MTEQVVSVRLKADGSGFVGQIRISKEELERLNKASQGAAKGADKFGRQADQAGRAAEKLGKRSRSLKDQMISLRGAIAAAGLTLLARQAVRSADSMALLRGRLNLVAREGDNVQAVMKDLFRRAQDARAEFETFGQVFFRNARALKEYGALANQSARFTELLAKSSRVSGAATQEMNAGLLQLSQGLASGELRGEELRSVMENIPDVARRLAEGLGVTIGELRALSEAGELTTEVITRAFLSQGEAIEAEFAKLPRTVAEARTQFNNEMARIIDDQNQATGATSGLVEAIDNLRGSIGAAAPVIASLGAGLANMAAFGTENLNVIVSLAGAYGTFRVASSALAGAQALMASNLVATTASLFRAVDAGGRFVRVSTRMRNAMLALNAAFAANPIGLLAVAVAALVGGYLLLRDRTDQVTEAEKARIETLDKIERLTRDAAGASKERAAALKKERDELVRTLQEELKAERARLAAARAPLAAQAPSTRGGGILGLSGSDISRQVRGDLDPARDAKLRRLNSHISALDAEIAETEKKIAGLDQDFKEADEKRVKRHTEDVENLTAGLNRLIDAADPVAAEMRKVAEAFALLDEAKAKGVDEATLTRARNAVIDGLQVRVTAERKSLDDIVDANDEAADEFTKIWDNARENVQRSLADTIDDVLGGKIDSIKDFWKSFAGIGRRAIAETLSAMVFSGGKTPEGTGKGGLGNILGGIFGKNKEAEDEEKKKATRTPRGRFGNIGNGGDADNGKDEKTTTGTFASGIKQSFKQAGELLKPLGDGLKKSFKPVFESFGKTFKGVFGRTTAEAFGQAFGGSQVGTMVAGLGKALGINMSGTGAQIGGAIGSFIPIPGGNIIGSIAGGLIGSAFGKTPVARASFKTGEVEADTFKNGKADVKVASGLVGAAQQQLDQITEALGGVIVDGIDLGGLGTRKKDYVFDPVGQGKRFGKDKSTRYKTPEEAVAAALEAAIDQGAVAGLSERANAVLKQFDDVNVALKEAAKVVNLERFIDSFTNPFKTAALDFERQAAERIKVARNYGFDVLEIERLNAKERTRFLDEQLKSVTGGVQNLLNDIKFGGAAEGSAIDRRAALIEERDKLLEKARGGDQDAINRVSQISADLLNVSAEAFGSTGQFADDRANTVTLLEQLIADTETRIRDAQTEAQAKLENASDPQLSEANQTLDDIALTGARTLAEIQKLVASFGVTTTKTAVGANGGLSAALAARLRYGGGLF